MQQAPGWHVSGGGAPGGGRETKLQERTRSGPGTHRERKTLQENTRNAPGTHRGRKRHQGRTR
eukprot:1565560-Alexandrium_andersonii.AAC.1